VGTLCGAEPRPVRDLVTTGNGTTSTPRHRVATAVRHRVHTAWRHRRLFTEIVACRINGQGVCLLVARDAAGSYSPADGVSRLCLVLRVRLYIVVVDFATAGPAGFAGGRESLEPSGKWWNSGVFEHSRSRGDPTTWQLRDAPDWIHDTITRSWWPGECVAGVPRVAYPGERVVQHYSELGLPLRRDEYDTTGLVVRSVDLHPNTGRPVGHRYFDTTGVCWLSTTLDSDGRPTGPVRQHRPNAVTHHSLLAAQCSWLDEHLQELPRARVLAIGPRARLLRDEFTTPEREMLN